MKKIFIAIFSFAALFAIADDASVCHVAARQRWPFSRVVDIDVILDGANCRDVTLSATYDGATSPINLMSGLVEGVPTLVPGLNRFVWDPVAAGLGGSNLSGFSVTAALESFDARKFLVIDLKDRSYAYYAEDPDGKNWSDDKYKLRYVVFRRVPAGVYRLGYTEEQQARWRELGTATGSDPNAAIRTVVISRDYYIAIYMLTVGQANAIAWHSEPGPGGVNGYYYGSNYVVDKVPAARAMSYWRGDFSDRTAGCTWPQNGHAVSMPECVANTGKSSGSLVGRFRQLMKNGNNDLPSNMIIDLPTEAQWEVAARAGTTTFYDGCGTLTDDADTIRDYQYTHFTNRSVEVGLMLPNSWGLYDTAGITFEMTLNVVSGSSTSDKTFSDAVQCRVEGQTVDPVGMTVADDESIWAVACNCGWTCRGFSSWAQLPSSRRVYSSSDTTPVATRLAIHLGPLVK